MNNRQYFSTGICNLIASSKKAIKNWKIISDWFVPRFPSFKLLQHQLERINYVKVYLIGFFFILFLQILFTSIDNVFLQDNVVKTKMFSEDWVNILNYSIICEFYLIIGLKFISKILKLNVNSRFLDNSNSREKFSIIELTKSIFPYIIIITSSSLVTIGYFSETTNYKFLFWFNLVPKLSFTGLYYVVVTFTLMGFLTWIGLFHFGLFSYSIKIANNLKEMIENKDKDKLKFWSDEDRVKDFFELFCNIIVISKILVLFLSLNIFTWMINIKEKSLMIEIAYPVLVIIGIWVFSLPRYYIQLHLLKLNESQNKYNYFDIRKPWNKGRSGIIDTALAILLVSDKFEYLRGIIIDNIV